MTQPVLETRTRYPLLSMWIWPQATFRDLIARDRPLAVLALSAIAGMIFWMALIALLAPGMRLVVHPAALTAIAAAAGIGGLYLCAALIGLTGAMIGGRATQRELRRALAWTTLPVISVAALITAIWLIWLALGAMMHPSSTSQAIDLDAFASLMLLLSPLGIWGIVVAVRAIAAVQKIGALRALLCLALTGVVIGYGAVWFADMLNRRFPSFVMPNAVMLPSLRPAERFLTAPLQPLSRGDIVVFVRLRNHPHFGIVSRHYVKRVIGLPGDSISMADGVLSINGAVVRRQRIADFSAQGADGQMKATPSFMETLPDGPSYPVLDSNPGRTLGGAVHRVETGQLLLLGDNRDDTDDVEDTYQGHPAPTHDALIWLDRVSARKFP